MSEVISEEEQVEALKKWWAENGKSVIAGLIIGLGGIWGWNWWGDHQRALQEQSSTYYQQLSIAVMQNDDEAVNKLYSSLKEQAPKSAYLVFSALDVAKHKVSTGDFETARLYLQRAVDNAPDAAFAAIASIRLARVLLQQKKFDEALAAISKDIPESMSAQASDVRGDIELAKGNISAAREAYTQALAGEVANSDIVKMKLDNLGTSKAS